MITELVLGVLASVVSFVGGLFPSMTLPTWLASIPVWIDSLGSYLTGMDAWVPWDHFATVLGFLALALSIALAIKLVRIVASFLTAGGGSAA